MSYTPDMVTPQLPLWSDKDAAEAWVVRESTRARRLTVRVFHTGRVEVVDLYGVSPRGLLILGPDLGGGHLVGDRLKLRYVGARCGRR